MVQMQSGDIHQRGKAVMSDASRLIAAFTEEQTERLTGVSVRQLRYWDKKEFFVPSMAYGDRRSPYSRLYSFRDLVALRIVNALRNEAGVSLQHLRQVKDKLSHLGEHLWAQTTLYVLNKTVIFHNPEPGTREEVVSGQAILEIPLRVVSAKMEESVRMMMGRDTALVGKIERHKNIAHNEAVLAGTRIPVRAVKAFADAGYTVSQIQKEYPTLTEEDIRAAVAHDAAA